MVSGLDTLETAVPVLTATAILPRDDIQTLAWFSSSDISGQTIYAPWTYNAQATIYTTSGGYFRRCLVASSCPMFTSCSNGYMLAESTSSFCGTSGTTAGTAPAQYCSTHILLPSLNAQNTDKKTWYWCDTPPLTGYTLFAQKPAEPTANPPLTSASISRSSFPTTVAPSSSPTSKPNPKPNLATPILGASIGSVAILIALALSILWTLSHDRRQRDEERKMRCGLQEQQQQQQRQRHQHQEFPLNERGETRVQLDAEASVARVEIGDGERTRCAELSVERE